MNHKEELKKIVDSTPNVAIRILKSRFKDVYKEVSKLSGKHDSERLYKYLNGKPIGCKHCGEETKFVSLGKGYQQYCGQSCMAKGTANQRRESAKKTFLRKYGVTSPGQLQSTKDKVRQHRENGSYDNVAEQMKKTKLKKYGDENYSNTEKCSQTKLQRYGDSNYNNRDKFKETMFYRYDDSVSPATRESTTIRAQSGEIGFGSKKFKGWMASLGIKNVSEIQSVKDKKFEKKLAETLAIVKSRIQQYVELNTTDDEFDGVGYYDKSFNFTCKRCGEVFDDYLYSANIPRCPMCFPKRKYTSVGQYELKNYIEDTFGLEVELNNRKLIEGELDIVIPQKKIAIEFDGIYWHSELTGNKDKKYHINKTNQCKEVGYRLIHILDIEWMYQNSIIKHRLSHILGNRQTLYARECVVKEISPKQKGKFLNDFHIQGNDKSQIRLGMFYKNDLVAVMTFGKLRMVLGNKKCGETEYEMYRFCSSQSVTGGASKLMAYFIKNYSPTMIVTYADNKWGFTDFYEQIGFKYDSMTPPGYWYFDTKHNIKKLYHRSAFQKHKLKKQLDNFDSNLTEWQNMQINGFDRIWDCGNLKFVWESDY